MRFAICATVLLVVATTVAVSALPEIDGILTITPENHDEVIGGPKPVLMALTAEWCSHCQRLAEPFTSLGKALKASGNKAIVANCDADKHGALGSKHGVSGFPTIKFFPAGSKDGQDYNGARDFEGFSQFLNEKANAGIFKPHVHSDVKEINGVDYDKVVGDKSKKLVFVAHVAPWCGHCKSMKPALAAVAKAFANEKSVVIASFNADAPENKAKAGSLGISGFPTLKYFIEGGEAQEYNGGRDLSDFISFVNSKAGTQRTADGSLDDTAGTSGDLNAAAAAYTANGDKAKFEAAAKDGSASEWYAKVAASIDSKGADFVEKELARVAKMLEGKLTPVKRDQMTVKKNVLSAFKKA